MEQKPLLYIIAAVMLVGVIAVGFHASSERSGHALRTISDAETAPTTKVATREERITPVPTVENTPEKSIITETDTKEVIDFKNIDSDNDGIRDIDDNCPEKPNPGQEDMDGDGFGNHCDNCPATPNSNQDPICKVCNDPDSSNDALVWATQRTSVFVQYEDSAGILHSESHKDECIDDITLREHYCNTLKVHLTRTQNCQLIMQNGICVNGECVSEN